MSEWEIFLLLLLSCSPVAARVATSRRADLRSGRRPSRRLDRRPRPASTDTRYDDGAPQCSEGRNLDIGQFFRLPPLLMGIPYVGALAHLTVFAEPARPRFACGRGRRLSQEQNVSQHCRLPASLISGGNQMTQHTCSLLWFPIFPLRLDPFPSPNFTIRVKRRPHAPAVPARWMAKCGCRCIK